MFLALAPGTASARLPVAHAAPAARFYSHAPSYRPRVWARTAYRTAPHARRLTAWTRHGRWAAAYPHRAGHVATVYYGSHRWAAHRHPVRLGRAWSRRTQRSLLNFAVDRPEMQVERDYSPSYGASNVVADALRFLGAGNVTGTRGPWCADYASMILRRTGHRPLAGRSASAAFAYGPRVSAPRPGDLVVLHTRAGYAGHVGFFAGWNHGQMEMVSGNWGHRVRVSPIRPGAVSAFIRV